MKNLVKMLPMKLKRFLFLQRKVKAFNQLSAGEMEFFLDVIPYVTGLIDVGARLDTFYSSCIADSSNPKRESFLFEANPIFARRLDVMLSDIGEQHKVFNVGIGFQKTDMYYFFDTQSFVEESKVGIPSRIRSAEKIKVRRLDDYISELELCNFLKSDIEEMDFYCLLGAELILPNIHFLQFELGLGMPFNGRFVQNEDYWDLLEPNFHLFLLRDEANPIFRSFPLLPLLLTLDENLKRLIAILQDTGVGFNIVGIRKNMGIPTSLESKIGAL
jgi:FkbM family methyltransferase